MSAPRNVLIVGSGKRVRETALPAFHRLTDRFRIARVFARTKKHLGVGGVDYEVESLDALTREEVAGADLVYLAVTKDAVPAVLARLAELDPSHADLLIDTPVVRFKHYRHVDRLEAFRAAWVAEDCTELPWVAVVREAVAAGAVGELRRVTFDRSAYAYHGVATAKALLGCRRVRSARRTPRSGAIARRTLRFADGRTAVVDEPRDYAVGRLLVEGDRGAIADRPWDDRECQLVEPVVEDGACRGLRIGDVVARFDDDEVALLGPGDPAAGIIARMEDHKRVGFLRLLRNLDAGRGAYPVLEALDDMIVDYHLEKLGRYVANPFTSARSPLARMLLRLVTLKSAKT